MAEQGAKVLVSIELVRYLRMALYRAGYDMIVCPFSSQSIIKAVIKEEPDMIVLSTISRDRDVDGLADSICSLALTKTPVVIALFALWAEDAVQRATARGVISLYLTADIAAEIVRNCVKATVSNRLRPFYARRELIEERLKELSINPELTGFHYLVDAIDLCARDQGCFRKMTTLIYPEVGRRHNAGRAAVERLIRHAIEAAWLKGDIEKQYAYFGNTIDEARGKPTNSEFIARVTEALRLEAIGHL